MEELVDVVRRGARGRRLTTNLTDPSLTLRRGYLVRRLNASHVYIEIKSLEMFRVKKTT